MAGHNKWSKVKHIKAVVDAKKGKVFSKMAREITIAAKNGGKDADLNPRLRTAVLNARAVNMPNENVERAIKKGVGELEGTVMEEITYEGYAPAGVAMMVETVTDNRNRTSQDLRTAFNKNGGNMGSAGAVAHLFLRRGEVRVPASAGSEDAMMELALEAGADDVSSDEEEHVLSTAPDQLYAVAHFLKDKGIAATSVKLTYQPATTILITDVDTAKQVLKLYDVLDDLDDTQNVHANFELSDEVIAQLDE